MLPADLSVYVNAGPSDLAYITECLDQSTRLVMDYVGDVTVPEEVLSRVVLEVGADLFYRKGTKHGTAQFADVDANPIRIARDPLTAAYPLLKRYVGGGFA